MFKALFLSSPPLNTGLPYLIERLVILRESLVMIFHTNSSALQLLPWLIKETTLAFGSLLCINLTPPRKPGVQFSATNPHVPVGGRSHQPHPSFCVSHRLASDLILGGTALAKPSHRSSGSLVKPLPNLIDDSAPPRSQFSPESSFRRSRLSQQGDVAQATRLIPPRNHCRQSSRLGACK